MFSLYVWHNLTASSRAIETSGLHNNFPQNKEVAAGGLAALQRCQFKASRFDYLLVRLFLMMLRIMIVAPLTMSTQATPQTTTAYSLASSSSVPVNSPDWPATARPLRTSTMAPGINAQPILDEGNRINTL